MWVALFVVTLATFGCKAENEGRQVEPARSSPSRTVGADELKAVFSAKNADQAIQAMNVAKGMRSQGDIIPYLLKAWSHPDEMGAAAEFVRQSRIRIEVADVLLQAHKNGYEGLPAADMADYARSLLNNPDPGVKVQAIVVLGVVNESRDIPAIEDIVLNGPPDIFRAAVSSLVKNCAADDGTLNRITEGLRTAEQRQILKEYRASVASIKRHLCRS